MSFLDSMKIFGVKRALDYLKKNPDMRKNDAIKAVARDRGVPKSVIYDQVCGKTAEKKDEP